MTEQTPETSEGVPPCSQPAYRARLTVSRVAVLAAARSEGMDRPGGDAHALLLEARALRQEARVLHEQAQGYLTRGDFGSYYELRRHCLELRQEALQLVHLAILGPG